MKEHILDIIIVETNKEHFKIWNDYFSKNFKIQIFNNLNSASKNKFIYNNDTVFIVKMNSKHGNFSKSVENKIIYIIDHNFSINNLKNDQNIFLKKPVSLSKIENIIYELKNYKLEFNEEIIKIKQHILISKDKKLYSNDRSEFIKLTEKEVQILIELGNSKIGSGKKYLLEKVWKYNPNINTSTVETHIHRLRKKLIRFSHGKITIKNGRLGYFIV